MQKVLFVTYFWPPSGKATVHWPLGIIKHLPNYGWQPLVLTADEDTFSSKDESLLKEVDPALKVFKARTIEPFSLYRRLLGKKKDIPLTASETISKTNRGLRHRLAVWIRMNLFIPDARIGWYWNAVRKGKEILRSENIQAIVSIGPPHTTLMVGKKLSQLFNIPHFPVLIDPWVDISYYQGLKRSVPTLAIDRSLERSVLEQSSQSIFVTESMKEDYVRKYPDLKHKSHVLYWGYNEEAFSSYTSKENLDSEIILHAGNIYDHQNPKVLWPALKGEIDKGRNLKLTFIGTVSPEVRQSIEKAGLNSNTEYRGFLPYKEMIDELGKAKYLLVCMSEKRHVPGKLFEYLRTGKIIIAFGEDNYEVENILRRANAGKMFSYQTANLDIFQPLSSLRPKSDTVKLYSRHVIAGQLAEILQNI
jgi:glycosyltransferase involved in cell wall biosynthesis